MTITQLQYIIAVDTHKSFARAAVHCYVSQPALSMQIKKIEDELGILIFDRSKKPVLTTDIGNKIIAHARTIVQEINRMPELIKEQKDEIRGILRIGIIPTLSPYLLPLFVSNFVKKYPDVNLTFEEILSDDIVERLNKDLLDVGILATPTKNRTILEIPIFYEGFVLYGHTDAPLMQKRLVDVNDLNIDDMWLLKKGHCFRAQSINICSGEQSPTRRIKFESGSLETLKKMVENRSGYTLLPELSVNDLDENYRTNVRNFKSPIPLREISMVTHRSYVKRKLVELLRDEILEYIPQKMKDKERGRLVEMSEK